MSEVVSPVLTKARRLKLAEQLIAHGRVTQNPSQPLVYHVTALDNCHAYAVQLRGANPCTCPDATYRRLHCKHYFAAALVHLDTLAMREETKARNRSSALERAAPRRGRPIWYEEQAVCGLCRSKMPATDPCPRCGRTVCLKCHDGMSGVCLACPGGG